MSRPRLLPIPPEEMCGRRKRRGVKPTNETTIQPAAGNTVPKGCMSKETLRLEWFNVIARADLLHGQWRVKAWTPARGVSETKLCATRYDALREMGALFALGCFPEVKP